MNSETKDFLRGILANAMGTLIAAIALAALSFFIGKFEFLATHWKEFSLLLVFLFIAVTFFVWFRKLLRIEKELEGFKVHQGKSVHPDYSKDITSLKSDLSKKADKSSVPDISAFKDIERAVKELKIFMYGEKKQMGEVMGLIELLKEDIDKDSWQIADVLEDLEKVVARMELKHDLITDIEEQLFRLDNKPKYNFLVSKIRKHYQG